MIMMEIMEKTRNLPNMISEKNRAKDPLQKRELKLMQLIQ